MSQDSLALQQLANTRLLVLVVRRVPFRRPPLLVVAVAVALVVVDLVDLVVDLVAADVADSLRLDSHFRTAVAAADCDRRELAVSIANSWKRQCSPCLCWCPCFCLEYLHFCFDWAIRRKPLLLPCRHPTVAASGPHPTHCRVERFLVSHLVLATQTQRNHCRWDYWYPGTSTTVTPTRVRTMVCHLVIPACNSHYWLRQHFADCSVDYSAYSESPYY
jgi:hypothetical protein